MLGGSATPCRLVNGECPVVPLFLKAAATTEIYTLSLHDALPISTIDQPSPEIPNVRLRGCYWRGGINRRGRSLFSRPTPSSHPVDRSLRVAAGAGIAPYRVPPSRPADLSPAWVGLRNVARLIESW